MLVVAVRVAQVVLEVADEHLRPVHEIERAVRRDGDAAGAEVRVLRDVGLDQVRHGLALQAGAFLGHLRAEDALDADDVGVEEFPLPVVREMAAAKINSGLSKLILSVG